MTLLLALALFLQESPETAFQKVEAAVENSRSLKVLFTLATASEPATVNRGSFSFDGDSSVKLSADLRSKTGERVAVWTEFDGKKMRSGLAGHEIELPYESRTARSNFNMYLSRLGLFAGAVFEHNFWSGAAARKTDKPMTVDLKQLFGVAKLADQGEGKGGTRILGYEFVTAFKPCPFTSAKVWYDPKTYQIRRREARLDFKGREETIVEEYEYPGDGAAAGGGKPATPTTPATEAEQDIRFIQARLRVATEHLKNGRKQKAIDVYEDLLQSFPKNPLVAEVQRLLEAAKQS